MTKKWRTLSLLAVAEMLAMSLWFSASAVTPTLIAEWQVSPSQAAWLTMTVQLGFVAGALGSALLNLADLYNPRKLFAIGAGLGALCNAAIPTAWIALSPATPAVSWFFFLILGLRFATGMTLAAVYPVGMKIMATWTREDRGLGIGLLVGALTVGSALPHLVRGFGGIQAWEPVLFVVSGLAAVGGLTVWWFVDTGPYHIPAPRFRWDYLAQSMRNRPVRLANFGYLGHMWELYAMWTWIGLFLSNVYSARPAAFTAFAVIGIGGLGSVVAGHIADRIGRTHVTMGSMIVSGTCAACVGLLLNHPLALTTVAIIWGFTIVADSAQFSTAISELGDPEYTGTLLTTQTAMGFLLTLVSIRLVPALVDRIGWTWAFASLAIGPVVGCIAMWKLRQSPASLRLAGGRR